MHENTGQERQKDCYILESDLLPNTGVDFIKWLEVKKVLSIYGIILGKLLVVIHS